MALQFISDYKDNPTYRLSFNELAAKTFGIDFNKWYQLGFWNDRYVCYSFVDDNRVVSNVSASKLDIIWEGRKISAVQIGTVMTAPEYRGQGLAAKLMNILLGEYEKKNELIYLFANQTVLDFYPKFGFVPVKECRFSAEIHTKARSSIEFRKLELLNDDDLKLLVGMILERIPISGILDVDHAESILLWHCLNTFSEDIYYLESLNAMVIAKVEDDTLYLYDMIGRRKPEFMEIFKRVAPEGVHKVVFYFMPDFEDIEIECHPYEQLDDRLFIKSARVHLIGKFLYPFTAHA